MRAVDGLDLPQDHDRHTDAFAAWLQTATGAAPNVAPRGNARGVLADAAGSLAAAFNAAIQVWQDFDDTAPLRPASGSGDDIENWLGPVRRERLRDCARRVRAAVAQMQDCLGAGGVDAADGGDVADGVGLATAQTRLRAGASPPDAARAAIARLTARLVQARTLANGIKDAPTQT